MPQYHDLEKKLSEIEVKVIELDKFVEEVQEHLNLIRAWIAETKKNYRSCEQCDGTGYEETSVGIKYCQYCVGGIVMIPSKEKNRE